MDADALRAAVERSRRFTHEVGACRFDLVLPTQFAIDCISAEHKFYPRMQRKLVSTALRGWGNVSTRELGAADIADEPLAFTADAAELLFNERPDIESALMDAIAARVQERRKALEEQQGN